MKHKLLRACIKRFVRPTRTTLENCRLVVDGKAFCGDIYKKSGCNYILGGEHDRFAVYLRTLLQMFKENNVTCYFIFKGARIIDTERRIEIYQELIDIEASVEPGKDVYCDPPFVKEVLREILDEFGMKWFVTTSSTEDIRCFKEHLIAVAKYYNCPILTNNSEMTLYGVTCVMFHSIASDYRTAKITFNVYDAEICKKSLFITDACPPIFLAMMDEDALYFPKITEIVPWGYKDFVTTSVQWMRQQTSINALKEIKKNLQENFNEEFMKSFYFHRRLCRYELKKLAVHYFENRRSYELYETDPLWFEKGVSNGRIPVSYINLFLRNTLSGSWMVQDSNKEDALLPAMEIIQYACGLLNNFNDTMISFTGRKGTDCCSWEIEFKYDKELKLSNKGFLKLTNKLNPEKMRTDFFLKFIKNVMPGFNFHLMNDIPKECWILMTSLVFYSLKNMDHRLVYSFVLSYVMLGPVSAKVGLIKQSNCEVNHNKIEATDEEKTCRYGLTVLACEEAAKKMVALYAIDNDDLKSKYDRSILQSFAEFQHCLQHMNHLNKLCGEKIPCTIYHKSINMTFVFNSYQRMMGLSNPLEWIQNILEHSPVLDFFMKIVGVFEQLLMIQMNA